MKKVDYNFDYILSIQKIDTKIGYSSYNEYINPLRHQTTVDNDINYLDTMIYLTKKDLQYIIDILKNTKKIGNNIRYLNKSEIDLNNMINKKQYYTFAFILYTHLFLEHDEFSLIHKELFLNENNKHPPIIRFPISQFLKGFNPTLDVECCKYYIQFIKDKIIIEYNQKFIDKEGFIKFFIKYKEMYGRPTNLPDNYKLDKTEELLRNYLKENIDLFDLEYICNFMNYNNSTNGFYREIIFEINDACWIDEIYGFTRFLRYSSFKINENEEEFKNSLDKAIICLIRKINNRMVTLRNNGINSYNTILQRNIFYNSCEIIEIFNLLRMRFMISDKNLITKYEKEINKLICLLYKFYLKNKKIISSYLNKIIREVSKKDYFYKNEYLMSIYHNAISNRSQINSYKLIVVRFVKNIIIKQNKRGVDVVKKFKITPNNLTILLTSDLF